MADKKLATSGVILLALANLAFIISPVFAAGSCLCTSRSTYCYGSACPTSQTCYQTGSDNQTPLTDQASCDNLGQSLSQPYTPVSCSIQTTDDCGGQGTLVSAQHIACNGTICSKSSKSCTASSDCTQPAGTVLCYNDP